MRMSSYKGENKEEDRISELPEPIIHHIVSFLPTRTRVLSKRWRDLLNAFPIINFEEYFFTRRWYRSNKTKLDRKKEFLEFVNTSLSSRNNSFKIDKFRLSMKYQHIDLASQINEWIQIALEHGVKELDLKIKKSKKSSVSGGVLFYYTYALPAEVFVAKTITSLSLKDCNVYHSGNINLPSLKSLHLRSINLKDQTLDILLSGCPLLKILTLEYCTLKKFQFSSTKTESVKFHSCYELKKAIIEAVNLKSFIFTGQDRIPYAFDELSEVCEINVFQCTGLETVSLENTNLTDKAWEDYISQLSFLQKLRLSRSYYLKRIKFSSKNVSLLHLNCNEMLEEVEIDAPHLVHFYYSGHMISLRSNNLLKLVEAEICTGFNAGDMNQCLKFRNFLENFTHCRCLKMYCFVEQELAIPKEMRERLKPPLRNLKHTKIKVVESSMNYAGLVESLLWMSPRLENLTIFSEFPSICVKYQFGEDKGKKAGSSTSQTNSS